MRSMVEGFSGVRKNRSTALRAVPLPASAGEDLSSSSPPPR